MSSTTSVSNEDVVRRRADGYHYNQWGDDLIDSLATSYEVVNYLHLNLFFCIFFFSFRINLLHLM